MYHEGRFVVSSPFRIARPWPPWFATPIGWDARSLILMVLDHGQWKAYRLPKVSHSYDGAHGWNTEWPRIREVGGGAGKLLMNIHGGWFEFPKTFSAACRMHDHIGDNGQEHAVRERAAETD